MFIMSFKGRHTYHQLFMTSLGVMGMVKNLRNLRLSRGISQQQLADVIGTSQQSINKYENHSIEPDINTLMQLADYFCVSVDYLIGHTKQADSGMMENVTVPDKEEISIIKGYRKLSKEEKESIRLIIRNYLKRIDR